jgi:DNA-binding HxlR family transcriptional regulator
VFLGLHRFDELQTDLGIARSMLTERLRALVAEGVLERIRYQEHPQRFEYHLTAKGRDLAPVLTALQLWGDAHASGPDGPPRRVVHTACQHDTVPRYVCSHCGDTVAPDQVRTPRVRRRPHVQAS